MQSTPSQRSGAGERQNFKFVLLVTKKEILMSGRTLRFINTLILVLFCILGLTGLYGLVWPFPSFLFEIHRIAAWALIILIPWKSLIAWRSLGRGLSRHLSQNILVGLSVVLSFAVLLVLILGFLWTWQIGPYYVWMAGYAYSGIGWHWGIALGLAPLFILHVWQRWPRPKKVDFSGRRQALKMMGLSAAAITGWGLAEALSKFSEQDGRPRSFTGSREQASFGGNIHPVTSGADQGRIKLDPQTWTLRVTGAVSSPLTLSYSDLLALSTSKVTATLDCTGGWYTVQTWRGLLLAGLLAQAQIRPEAAGILLRGVFEYSAPFLLPQAQEILLATHVGVEVLNHSHGFPLRAVVPSRRGWHWVKWLTEIQVVGAP